MVDLVDLGNLALLSLSYFEELILGYVLKLLPPDLVGMIMNLMMYSSHRYAAKRRFCRNFL